MPKVVIDANVIVSSLFGGTPRKAFLKALRTCDIVISPDIRVELTYLMDILEKKLGSAKTKRLRSIVLKLLSSAKEVNPARKVTLSRDRKDDSSLSLCLTVRADFLLTGDKDLLEIPPRQLKSAGLNRLSIVSPNTFLAS